MPIIIQKNVTVYRCMMCRSMYETKEEAIDCHRLQVIDYWNNFKCSDPYCLNDDGTYACKDERHYAEVKL